MGRIVCGVGVSMVIAGAMAVVPSLAPESADATFPGRDGKIAYSSLETYNASLRTIDPRTGTRGWIRPECPERPCSYHYPAWSPTGKRLAFDAEIANGTGGLMVSRPDGSGARRVARDLGCPAWSPRGRRLAAVDEDGALVVISVSEPGRRLVVLDRGGCPDWSSRNRIAFTRFYRRTPQSSNSFDVMTVRPSGNGLKRLTRDGSSLYPNWSPHGSKIAYTRFREGGGIWVMNADGSGKRQIVSRRRGSPYSPVWSPDGAQIAFIRKQAIFVIASNGSGSPRRIRRADTMLPSPLNDLDWQPRP